MWHQNQSDAEVIKALKDEVTALRKERDELKEGSEQIAKQYHKMKCSREELHFKLTSYRAVMKMAVEALDDCEATLEVMRNMGKAIDHTQCLYMMNEAGDTIDHFVDPALTTLREALEEEK